MVNFLRCFVKHKEHSLIPSSSVPSVYPQDAIIKKSISENALKVLHRLNKAGYEAYLVGGGIRDLLLQRSPKDFDIATNATPEQIKRLFRNCRLIGKRFRLAHILFHQEIIEVATFRGELQVDELRKETKAYRTHNGMVLRDNIYGTIEQDAWRRDFSINSFYYDPNTSTVRDYTDGMTDLTVGIIRLIGDPDTRYREDPVRMLRALRFSAKLGFKLEQQTAALIYKFSYLLKSVPAARLFDESIKLLQSGYGADAYPILKEYQIFEVLFPRVAHQLANTQSDRTEKIILQALKNTDERIANNHHIEPAFLISTMLWYPLVEHTEEILIESGLHYNDAFAIAANNILQEQNKITMLPKRITMVVHDIWMLQLKFIKPNTLQKTLKILSHPKFKAGYNLLILRSVLEGNKLKESMNWWSMLQTATPQEKIKLLKELNKNRNYYRRSASKRKTKIVTE